MADAKKPQTNDDEILNLLGNAGQDEELLNLMGSAGQEEAGPTKLSPETEQVISDIVKNLPSDFESIQDPAYRKTLENLPDQTQEERAAAPAGGEIKLYTPPAITREQAEAQARADAEREAEAQAQAQRQARGASIATAGMKPLKEDDAESQARVGLFKFINGFGYNFGAKLMAQQMAQKQMLDDLQNGVKHEDPEKSYNDYYERALAGARAFSEQGKDMYPKTSFGSELAGIVATPGPKTKLATTTTRAGRMLNAGVNAGIAGGIAGLGGSEAETLEGQAVDSGQGALLGFGLGAGMQGAGEGLSFWGRKLKDKAASLAFRALSGKAPADAAEELAAQQQQALRDIGRPQNQAGLAADNEVKNMQIGRTALERDVLKPVGGPKAMAKAVDEARDYTTKELQLMAQAVERAAPMSNAYTMNPAVVDETLQRTLMVYGKGNPANAKSFEKIYNKLGEFVEKLEAPRAPAQGELFGVPAADKGGRVTFGEAYQILRSLQEAAEKEADPVAKELMRGFSQRLQKDIGNQALGIISMNAAEVGPDVVSQMANKSQQVADLTAARGLLEKAGQPKKMTLEQIAALANPHVAAMSKAKETFGGSRVSALRAQFNNAQSMVKSALGQTAQKFAQSEGGAKTMGLVAGAATADTSFDRVKKAMDSDPAVLGDYAPLFEKAKAESGERGMMLQHYVLLNRDPNYQQLQRTLSNE